MIIIAGYQINEVLHDGFNSSIYRGQYLKDNQSIILKILKPVYPPPERIARFKQEYEVTHSLNLTQVVKAYRLENNQNRWMMILEDFGGESLARLNLAGTISLVEFLKLAIQIADSLDKVHQHRIMHKDINLSNIVLNPDTGQLKLIDFGISTRLHQEKLTFHNPTTLEGTLAYMSPEQTGRMNRSVDYRTDFYSLGIMFYELLTGYLPFSGQNALEVVHAHIAKTPPPFNTYGVDLPQPIINIVMKLLAKNAEERYQSAYGLKADLEQCLAQWQAIKDIQLFQLGQSDVSGRFQIPQKLYGRENELKILLSAFERINQSPITISEGISHSASPRNTKANIQQTKKQNEIVLVSGHPGIGKTALIQEIYKPITRQRGYFITGKFEQLQRNIPYLSLLQAFRALIHQLLTEKNEKIADWREKLLAALGSNGQVMINVIPEIELIIGPQPAVPELPATETKNRFHLVYQNFIRVFTKSQHPLVIFLDDLQWADSASLNLMKILMTGVDSQHLFFIGAYRDKAIQPGHPLLLAVQEMEKAGVIINHIPLPPLNLSHITHLMADTLVCSYEKIKPLAELALTKTGGNPFFLNEFLKSLYAKKLIVFDFKQRVWQWNLENIQTHKITDNVVELMANKIQQLQSKTQNVLNQAACIGNQFDLETLSIVHQKTPKETAADLWEAISEGLILPLDTAYKWTTFDIPDLLSTLKVTYKFAHDRIQQAVYSFIPKTDKQAMHWQLGHLLLQYVPANKQIQKIFDIVNHLNLGSSQAKNQKERTQVARLNLKAGQQAKASAAYDPAFNYLQMGIGLLGEITYDAVSVDGILAPPPLKSSVKIEDAHFDCWQAQYDLILALCVEAAETAYLTANFVEMERLTNLVLKRATTLLDKVNAYEVKILAYIAQNKLVEAVEVGLLVLSLFNIEFPKVPKKSDVVLGLADTKAILRQKRIEDLIDLPEMTEPYKLAAMRILIRIDPAAFLAVPTLFPLLIFKEVNLSIEWGNTPLSTLAYAAYGLLLCGRLGDIETGYRFGQLALNLLDKLDAKPQKSRTYLVTHNFIIHWKRHIKEIQPALLEAYQSGLETGDISFAAHALQSVFFNAYIIGQALTGLKQEAATYTKVIGQLKQVGPLHYMQIYQQVVLNLLDSETPWCLMGESYNEEKMLPLHKAENDRGAMFGLYLMKLMLAYWFGAYTQALDNIARVEGFLEEMVGLAHIGLFYFYDSLIRLATLSSKTNSEQKDILKKVSSNQKKLGEWAGHAAMNYLHKFFLVEAELAHVQNNYGDAREYYDLAINLAQKNEFIQEEGLAYELAARFYLSRELEEVAQVYLRGAYYAYQRWGALTKLKQLESQYSNLLTQSQTSEHLSVNSTPSSATGQRAASALDLSSVIKASQTISSEIDLDKLLGKLIKIVIENAGAQRGCLVLTEKERLLIEAEAAIDQGEVRVLQSISIDTQSQNEVLLSSEIVHYVARTRKNIVLNDASGSGDFIRTPYILHKQPKSILCVPMLNQGELIGIIYLENNLTTNAFTSARVEIVRLLGTQATISITNAQVVAARAEQERLRLENEFLEKQSSELAKLNADKDKFFSIVSHDLKTPFIGLLGNTEFMLMDIEHLSRSDITEMAQDIHTSAKAVYNLLENLLTWSLMQRGRMKYQPQKINIRELAETTVNLLKEMAIRKDITLKSTVEAMTFAYADRNMLDTVIRNLTSNALKFTPGGGSVTISAVGSQIKTNQTQQSQNNVVESTSQFVVVSVADTGVGIEPEAINKLFKIDVYHSTSGTAQEQGTGLGLIMCKQMVEENGGRIWIESELGKGTTAKFTVPVAFRLK